MSIELHCSQCQRLIRAPDSAGGRRGKCPFCGNSVYIPLPHDDHEEIGLAPVDEAEERRAEEERRKAIRDAAEVAHMTDIGPDGGGARAAPDPADSTGDLVDAAAEVALFIRAMGASKLEEADAAVNRLKRIAAHARDYLEGLMVDELPPAFDDIPTPVVMGFLKTLLGRLK